ncbi:hypothetical protein LXA43DRAFT_1159781 [Ganoderma leucocontextum]|nr:hypothetical protein LXA43DRAFT_1159781 [Ganoderma leucocontextum]
MRKPHAAFVKVDRAVYMQFVATTKTAQPSYRPSASNTSARRLLHQAPPPRRNPRPRNGLEKQFEQNSRSEGDSNRFPTRIRATSAPSVLRKIMRDAIPANAIKWGRALTSVRPLDGGEHKLTFANGRTLAMPIHHGVTGAKSSLAPDTVKLPELKETVEKAKQGMLCTQANGTGASALTRGSLPPELGHPARACRSGQGTAGGVRRLGAVDALAHQPCDRGGVPASTVYQPLDHT